MKQQINQIKVTLALNWTVFMCSKCLMFFKVSFCIWHETTPTQTLEDAGLVCYLNYDPRCDPLSPVAQRVTVLRNRISKEAAKVRWVMGDPNAKWVLSV